MKVGFFAAMAACVMGLFATAEAQVSNSLGAATDRELPDIAALEATYDPIFFDPAIVRYFLEEGGLTIVQDQAYPENDAHLIIGTIGGLPFIYAFVECDGGRCGILKQIHVAPTTVAGLSFPPNIINELNTAYSLGAFFTQEGNLGYRYSIAAAPDCGDACLLSQMKIFTLIIDDVYGMISTIMNQNTAALEPGPMADAFAGRQPDFASAFATSFDVGAFEGIATAGGLDVDAMDIGEMLAIAGIYLSDASGWDALIGN